MLIIFYYVLCIKVQYYDKIFILLYNQQWNNVTGIKIIQLMFDIIIITLTFHSLFYIIIWIKCVDLYVRKKLSEHNISMDIE